MSTNCDIIVIFPIYGQFGAIRKPDCDALSLKLTFSIIVTFILQKLKTELNNLQHSSHTIALSKGTISTRKCWYFEEKKNFQLLA